MKTKRIQKGLILTVFVLFIQIVLKAQSSTLVYFGSNGKLVYKADARGNVVPDYSYVGYHQGELSIPDVPVVKTISADTGDNLNNIQNAINEVGNRTPDANGIRGAILLKAGTYRVSNNILLNKSGVILRGEGNTTHLIATRREQHSLIVIGGSSGPSYNTATKKKITDSYVPIGVKTITVEPGHTFKVGDKVILERKPNQAWIQLLGMDKLKGTVWTTSAYTFYYKRVVAAVNGNKITIDAPVMDPIDPQYAEGSLYTYTWDKKVENCGVENMMLDSEYSSSTDEQHGWVAVKFTYAENCWMQKVDAYHFGYAAADMDPGCYKISVLNCQYLEPISQTTGGRKYSFNIGGQQCLVKDCHTNSGRHDFVLDARTPGPNAFVNCKADNQKDDSGPHQRWAVGCLYDNVSGNRELNVMNRLNSGTGHGWAGTQMMFWNCKFAKHTVQDPPADHINWAIGCTAATITGNGRYTKEPIGYVESQGKNVIPQSLYEQQLKDRLTKDCTPTDIIPYVQINSGTWTKTNLATLDAGGSVKLGPQPASGGSWKWTGPNGFTSTSREITITKIQLNQGGSYIAIFTNDQGCSSSSQFTLTVNTVIANKAPVVSITSPANNTSYTAPASLSIIVSASDSDGAISKVDFYNDTNLLGTINAPPYTFAWNNVVAGNYTLTAKATDNKGSITTSGSISIIVKEPATNNCTSISQYVENGGYSDGSKVQNAGGIYQCKPWPYSGWCNGAAWAYGPGTGAYWADAWIQMGTCNSARLATVSNLSNDALTITPNPTTQTSLLKLNDVNNSNVEYIVINSMGVEIMKGTLDHDLEGRIDLSKEKAGIYLIKIVSENSTWMKQVVKE
jgi:hypothetical protein